MVRRTLRFWAPSSSTRSSPSSCSFSAPSFSVHLMNAFAVGTFLIYIFVFLSRALFNRCSLLLPTRQHIDRLAHGRTRNSPNVFYFSFHINDKYSYMYYIFHMHCTHTISSFSFSPSAIHSPSSQWFSAELFIKIYRII